MLRKCENIGKLIKCSGVCDPRVGPCDCKEGYYRNKCGCCVEPCQRNATCTMDRVTKCTRANEVLVGCLPRRKHRTCANLGRDLWPKNGELCEPQMCDCSRGYWRNDVGDCVSARKCRHQCGRRTTNTCHQPNEERVGCGYYEKSKYAIQHKCSGHTRWYRRNRKNQNKCICRNNFVQSDCKSKRCILKENCDRPCECTDPCARRKYERYTVINACNENTCENMRRQYFKACEEEGVFGCDCIDGYWRNSKGDRVPPEECDDIIVPPIIVDPPPNDVDPPIVIVDPPPKEAST